MIFVSKHKYLLIILLNLEFIVLVYLPAYLSICLPDYLSGCVSGFYLDTYIYLGSRKRWPVKFFTVYVLYLKKKRAVTWLRNLQHTRIWPVPATYMYVYFWNLSVPPYTIYIYLFGLYINITKLYMSCLLTNVFFYQHLYYVLEHLSLSRVRQALGQI